jgi:RecA-family ATPase
MGGIYAALGMPDEEFTGEAQFHLSPALLFKHLRDAVSKGCRFIILDTLFDALQVASANDYSEVKPRLGSLNHFAQQHNIHILVVHHTNKTGSGRNQNDISGSAAIAAAMIHNILVSIDNEEEADAVRSILSVKHKYPESMGGKRFRGEEICITETSCTLGAVQSTAEKKISRELQLTIDIFGWVWAQKKPVTKQEIENAVKGTASTKRQIVDDLLAHGFFTMVGRKIALDPRHQGGDEDQCRYALATYLEGVRVPLTD